MDRWPEQQNSGNWNKVEQAAIHKTGRIINALSRVFAKDTELLRFPPTDNVSARSNCSHAISGVGGACSYATCHVVLRMLCIVQKNMETHLISAASSGIIENGIARQSQVCKADQPVDAVYVTPAAQSIVSEQHGL